MNPGPSIVLVTSDQHRGDCFGFEGRPVKTPHLDFLARNGTRFSSCITPSPVCQPARASILTGLLTLACLVRAAYNLFWAPSVLPEPAGDQEVREVPFLMYFSMTVLAFLCLVIGFFPNILYPVLDSATRAVLSIWTMGQ